MCVKSTFTVGTSLRRGGFDWVFSRGYQFLCRSIQLQLYKGCTLISRGVILSPCIFTSRRCLAHPEHGEPYLRCTTRGMHFDLEEESTTHITVYYCGCCTFLRMHNTIINVDGVAQRGFGGIISFVDPFTTEV